MNISINHENQTVTVTRFSGVVETGKIVKFVNKRNQNYKWVKCVVVEFEYPSSDGMFVTKETFQIKQPKGY